MRYLAWVALLAVTIIAPEFALAQASPFLTGATSLQTNSRVAREYLVALPSELSAEEHIRLVAGFSRELVERYRFALDVAIHAPRDFLGSDPRNFHAHLLATTREATLEGLGAKTTLEWNDAKRREAGLGPAIGELLHVRQRWAEAANASLEQAHVAARIDHRTLRAQGIDREPYPHIPRVAYELERRGYRSVVADRIREEHQSRVEARLQAQSATRPVQPKNHQEIQSASVKAWLEYRKALTEPAVPDAPSRKRENDHSL